MSDNDERRGGGIVIVVFKYFVVVWDIEINEEDGCNEEGEDVVESLFDSWRNSFVWISSFISFNINEFSVLVVEVSGDEYSLESDEVISWVVFVNYVWVEGIWVILVFEVDVVLVIDVSVDVDGEDDEVDDGDDFDVGELYFEFFELVDGEVVGGSEDDLEDGDLDIDVDFCGVGLVLDDEFSSSEF